MPNPLPRTKLFAAALTLASAAVVAGGTFHVTNQGAVSISLASAGEGPSTNEPATTVTSSAHGGPSTSAGRGTEDEVDDSTTEATEPSTTERESDDTGDHAGTTAVHPDNHGAAVSAAARDKSLTVDGNHGRAVSEVARQNAPTTPSTSVPDHPTPSLPSQAQGHAGNHLPD